MVSLFMYKSNSFYHFFIDGKFNKHFSFRTKVYLLTYATISANILFYQKATFV